MSYLFLCFFLFFNLTYKACELTTQLELLAADELNIMNIEGWQETFTEWNKKVITYEEDLVNSYFEQIANIYNIPSAHKEIMLTKRFILDLFKEAHARSYAFYNHDNMEYVTIFYGEQLYNFFSKAVENFHPDKKDYNITLQQRLNEFKALSLDKPTIYSCSGPVLKQQEEIFSYITNKKNDANTEIFYFTDEYIQTKFNRLNVHKIDNLERLYRDANPFITIFLPQRIKDIISKCTKLASSCTKPASSAQISEQNSGHNYVIPLFLSLFLLSYYFI